MCRLEVKPSVRNNILQYYRSIYHRDIGNTAESITDFVQGFVGMRPDFDQNVGLTGQFLTEDYAWGLVKHRTQQLHRNIQLTVYSQRNVTNRQDPHC